MWRVQRRPPTAVSDTGLGQRRSARPQTSRCACSFAGSHGVAITRARRVLLERAAPGAELSAPSCTATGGALAVHWCVACQMRAGSVNSAPAGAVSRAPPPRKPELTMQEKLCAPCPPPAAAVGGGAAPSFGLAGNIAVRACPYCGSGAAACACMGRGNTRAWGMCDHALARAATVCFAANLLWHLWG